MSTSTSSAQLPPPTHPAFPALIPSTNLNRSFAPSSIPTTPSAVQKLINTSSSSLSDIHSILIPSLHAVAGGKTGKDLNEKERDKAAAKGEEILALFDEDLNKLGEVQIRGMTAGLVFVVSARLHSNHTDQPTYNADLLTIATSLCLAGDPRQLYACGSRLGDLAWGILRLAKHLKTPESALAPLQYLIHSVMAHEQLSGVHAAFLEACLLTRQYDAGYETIHNLYIDVKSMSPSYLDVITFFHHAGLICAATQKWEKAIEHFSMAVAVPTSAASAVQLACAKRAILCGLLHDGKMVNYPKYTAGVVTRIVERNAKEYVKLAEAFIREDWKTVKGCVGVKEFKDDCSLGLLEQVIASIPVRQILKLKSFYSRMRLSDIASKLGISGQQGQMDVLNLLRFMIASKRIRATISESSAAGSSPIVSFMEEDLDYTSPEALRELKHLNAQATWLETNLTRGGRELGVHKEYLKKQAQMIDMGSGKGGKGKNEDIEMIMSDMMPGGFGAGKGGKMKGVGANMDDMGF